MKRTMNEEAKELRKNENYVHKSADYSEKIETQADFFSQPFSRLLAGLVMLIAGVINLILLGAGVGLQALATSGTGSAFILGGFSWFYFSGLLPIILGLCLIIYYIVANWQGRIGRSKNLFVFHEKRPNTETLTEVYRANFVGFQYRNTKLGPKKIWILILIPIGFVLLQWGLPLFGQPRAQTETLPSVLLFTVIAQTVAMFILVLKPQKFFEVVTKKRYYEFWFEPKTIGANVDKKIVNVMGYLRPHESLESKDRADESADYSYVKKVGNFRFPLRMVVGLFLLAVSIIGGFAEVLFGTYFIIAAVAFGVLLIVEALNKDFTDSYEYLHNKSTGEFSFYRKYRSKFHVIGLKNVDHVEKNYGFRKLNIYHVILVPYLLVIGYIQIHLSFISLLYVSPAVIVDLVLLVIVFAILTLIILTYWTIPIPVLSISGQDLTHQFELPQTPRTGIFEALKRGFDAIKTNSELKKTFLVRLLFIASLIILAMVISLIIF